jgi:Ca2+-binding EF-hand superfamily protein
VGRGFEIESKEPDLMASEAEKHQLTRKIAQLVAKKFGGDFRKAFDHYDTNKDGRIGKTELLPILVDAGIGNWLTRGAWADGIIAEIDLDQDGAISLGEFEAVVK